MDMRSYARRLSWAAIAAAMCAARLTFAAERLPIETEPQSVAIHPIAPEDGAEAVTNPPAMVFWWTGEVATYTVEMAQDVDFGDAILRASTVAGYWTSSCRSTITRKPSSPGRGTGGTTSRRKTRSGVSTARSGASW